MARELQIVRCLALEQATHEEDEGLGETHELAAALAARGLCLNATLLEMLSEHYSHRTERRGSGFTQSTRHLAVLVNQPRLTLGEVDAVTTQLFPALGQPKRRLTEILAELPTALEREESRLLLSLIRDLVRSEPNGPLVRELCGFAGEIKVGTCPLAEKYFLEVGHGFVRRKGRVNVMVSDAGEPLLIEKMNLGDNHSCISVTEVVLNGVRLPAGCLFGVARDEGVELRSNSTLPGSIIPVGRCTGFRFLRLTTLAVAPQHRRRAFTTHFQSQLDAGLFAPGETTIEQLQRVAEEQL
jgi:hypothetical protein